MAGDHPILHPSIRLRPLREWITSRNVFDWFTLALWLGAAAAERLWTSEDDKLLAGPLFLIVTLLLALAILGHVTERRSPADAEPTARPEDRSLPPLG